MIKLFKLAAIVAVFMCGQALGQGDIAFTLELGGDNHTNGDPAYDPGTIDIPFTPGDEAPDQTFSCVITWDVVAELSGAGTINGIANIVFDLELYEDDGVTPGEWDASDTPAGCTYYSTVNDGIGGNQHNAAFCTSFNVGDNGTGNPPTYPTCSGTGRAFDFCADGGPYMDRIQYPSSEDWPTAAENVASNELLGMGCGYSKYKPTGVHFSKEDIGVYNCNAKGGDNTAGVGLPWEDQPWGGGDEPVYNYWPGLGLPGDSPNLRPICEGQIELDPSLPEGQYVLKLVAGNCNVLMNDFDPEVNTSVGDFAVPADSVTEDTISFYYEYCDWGDAPDSYSTLAASNGPRHTITALMMGAAIDGEPDGQPSVNADLDDTTGVPDDEDGVIIPLLTEGVPANISVTVTADCLLDAWIDFNGNGVFDDPAEHIDPAGGMGAGVSIPLTVAANPNQVAVTAPVGSATHSPTYARFRVSTAGNLTPYGPAANGEVEDYESVEIQGAGCDDPPSITKAESILLHAGTPYAIDILNPPACEMRSLNYNAAPPGPIDPGPDTIEITFDMEVAAYDGTLNADDGNPATTDEFDVSQGNVDSLILGDSDGAGPKTNDMIIADVSGFSDRSCLTVTVQGMACVPNPLPLGEMAPVLIDVVILAGNCDDADLQVNINDVLMVKNNWFQACSPANFKADVAATDCQVNINDVLMLKYNWFKSASCP